jgi:hypothetical protein
LKSAESRQVIDGRIAVEDLVEEQMDEGHGVEEASTPGVPDLAAGVEDLRPIELLGWHLLEATKDADDPVMH